MELVAFAGVVLNVILAILVQSAPMHSSKSRVVWLLASVLVIVIGLLSPWFFVAELAALVIFLLASYLKHR